MRPALPMSMLVRMTLALCVVLVVAAPAARAEEPAPPAETTTRPVTSSGGPLAISSGPFGDAGQLVFSMASEGEFPFRFSKAGGGDWTLRLRPSLDYFIKEHLSVGGLVRIDTGGGQSTIGLGARVGYDLALASAVSLWIRGGLSYDHTSGNNASSSSVTTLDVLVPFLFHLVPHFFLGVGPFFSQPLTDSRPNSNKDATFGLTAIVGGYL
jgi:opacity protein-like surface antigen